jgi:hypothetical protein
MCIEMAAEMGYMVLFVALRNSGRRVNSEMLAVSGLHETNQSLVLNPRQMNLVYTIIN